MSKIVTREIDLNGRKLKLETGKLAKLADAAVVASWGETVVLATVATQPLKEDPGYFPLSVEYVEKYYASGRITAQRFIKRESRPSDGAVLSGRAIDRSIRPLFPKDFHNEVQVIISVLSYDGINDPALLGFIAASATLQISSVPFDGPMGVSCVGMKDGKFVVNPDLPTKENLDLELLVATTPEKVAMIEAEGKEVDDAKVFEGIKLAHAESQKLIELITDFAKEAGKEKQALTPATSDLDEKLVAEVEKEVHTRIETVFSDPSSQWHEGTATAIKQEMAAKYAEKLNDRAISTIFDKVAKTIMHETVLEKGKRVDGRGMEEVRAIDIELGILPRAHGSAVFQRGGTQVLSIATLGPMSLSQTLEGMVGESTKRFMHHYNMGINPFSVGEVKRLGSPNRRDVGHGALVEKGLVSVLPTVEEFPYAVRVVSEVLSANASTSMASLCAATCALLNAGVKLQNPAAGIAMGLLSNEGDPSTSSGRDSKKSRFQVITDMQAVEDFYGEMDFKIIGTVKGVTAIQMDTKLHGLTFEIIEEALRQGKVAREFILEKINSAIPKAGEISQYAPKIEVTHIAPEDIGALIGPGGKNINGIIARTGAQIDIEEDGTVMISSCDEAAIKNAMSAVEGMFKKFEVGEVMDGKVVRIAPFGAFVEIAPGKDGLVHVSQMAVERVENPEDVVNVGQTVKVRVTDTDASGKIGLSMLFGNDIKPDSEGRPSGGFRPRGEGFGGRRDFGGSRKPFGSRDGGRDRGGRGGFDR